MRRLAPWLLAWWLATGARAHAPTTSALVLEVRERVVRGLWHVPLLDLDLALGLDQDADGAITWGELRASHPAIAASLLPHLEVRGDERPCPAQVTELLFDDLDGVPFAVLRLQATCPEPPRRLAVRNDWFFDLDPAHRSALTVRWGDPRRHGVLTPAAPTMVVDRADEEAPGPAVESLGRGLGAAFAPPAFLLVAVLLLGSGGEGAAGARLAFFPAMVLTLTLTALGHLPGEAMAWPAAGGALLLVVGVHRGGRRLHLPAALLGAVATGSQLGAARAIQGLPHPGRGAALLAFEVGVLVASGLLILVGIMVRRGRGRLLR